MRLRREIHDPDNPVRMTSMTEVRFALASSAGLFVFVLAIIGAIFFVPESSVLFYAILPFFLGCSTFLILLKILMRAEPASEAQKHAEYQQNLQTERAKQMDQMLSDNSNIPKVEKSE